MEKLFDIWPLIKERKLSEFRLAGEELGGDNYSLLFCRLEEREVDRPLSCAAGETAFCYIVEGAIRFSRGKSNWTMVEGEALLLEEEQQYRLSNPRGRPSLYLLVNGRR